MGERLLCKQEVVGSIPSASRAGGKAPIPGLRGARGVVGRGFGFQGLDHCRWAGFGVWGLECVCSLWIVNQVLVRFGRAGRFGRFCWAV